MQKCMKKISKEEFKKLQEFLKQRDFVSFFKNKFHEYLDNKIREMVKEKEAVDIISPVFFSKNGEMSLYEDNLSIINYSDDRFTIEALDGVKLDIPYSMIKNIWINEHEIINLELDVAIIYYENGKSMVLKSLCLFYGLANKFEHSL